MKYCYHCMTKIVDDSAVFCPECGNKCNEHFARSEELPAGTVIGKGRYIVGKSIGSGGFGITYIGRDLNINKKVVIKETFYSGLFSRNCYDTRRSNRFEVEYSDISFEKIMKKTRKECENLASAEGLDNIVKVYDYFYENNTSYIITEFIDGYTLNGKVNAFGRYSWSELYKKIEPLMQSLAELHNMGILHRDIKPDNIMLKSGKRSGDKFVLIDFGLARSSSTQTTATTGIAFSPGYSPFEQRTLSGEDGAFIDVYALAATIYFALTGESPNTGVSENIYINFPKLAVLSSEYGVPGNVVGALRKALNPNFRMRTQSIDKMIDEFEKGESDSRDDKKADNISSLTQRAVSVVTEDTVAADNGAYAEEKARKNREEEEAKRKAEEERLKREAEEREKAKKKDEEVKRKRHQEKLKREAELREKKNAELAELRRKREEQEKEERKAEAEQKRLKQEAEKDAKLVKWKCPKCDCNNFSKNNIFICNYCKYELKKKKDKRMAQENAQSESIELDSDEDSEETSTSIEKQGVKGGCFAKFCYAMVIIYLPIIISVSIGIKVESGVVSFAVYCIVLIILMIPIALHIKKTENSKISSNLSNLDYMIEEQRENEEIVEEKDDLSNNPWGELFKALGLILGLTHKSHFPAT